MPESVSSVTTFNLPVDEIIEEALEHVGGDHASGQDVRSARRSLNLLFQDMLTRGYPLLQTEQRSFPLVIGQTQYSLGTDVLSILDVMIEDTPSNETQMKEMALLDYFNIPNKTTTTNLPTNYAFDRSTNTPKMFIYQTPSAVKTVKYWCVKKPKAVTASYQLADVAERYLPALRWGLAFLIALKKPMFPMERTLKLEELYEKSLMLAFEEDRQSGDLQVFPDGGSF